MQAKERWPKRLSAWKAGERLPATENELLIALEIIAPGASRKEWINLWLQARAEQDETQILPPGTEFHAETRNKGSNSALGTSIGIALSQGPYAYEVHPSIAVDQLRSSDPHDTSLTHYLSREIDRQLVNLIQGGVSGTSGILALVGGSSTGKTRACWEALKLLPSQWRVWHPLTAEELLRSLEPGTGNYVAPRTVLWLNELQRYLLPADSSLGEQVAVLCRSLLTEEKVRPIIILGTIWPDQDRWGTITATPAQGQPDPHYHSRLLLADHSVPVPETVTGADRVRAQRAALEDPRWLTALSEGGDRPIQFLAGSAYLLRRYRTAAPQALAVLNAAGDARKAGGPQILPLSFLRVAAEGYLSDVEWQRIPVNNQTNWVDGIIIDPVSGLCVGARGVHGPLRLPRSKNRTGPGQIRGSDQIYELADYLEQHIRWARVAVQPPDSLWYGAVATITEPTTLLAMAKAAKSRGRYRPAAALAEKAVELGSVEAMRMLAELLDARGAFEEAEALALKGHAMGDADAIYSLFLHTGSYAGYRNTDLRSRLAFAMAEREDGRGYVKFGDEWESLDEEGQACSLYRKAAQAGHEHSKDAVAWFEAQWADSKDGKIEASKRISETNYYLRCALAGRWMEAGEIELAESLLQQLCVAGYNLAMARLIDFRMTAGDREAAEKLVRQWWDSGYQEPVLHLQARWLRNEDPVGAERHLRWVLSHSDSRPDIVRRARHYITQLRLKIGDPEEISAMIDEATDDFSTLEMSSRALGACARKRR